MTASADVWHPRGGGFIAAMAGLLGLLVLASSLPAMSMPESESVQAVAAVDADFLAEIGAAHAPAGAEAVPENIPPLEAPVDHHAFTKHPEAVGLWSALTAWSTGGPNDVTCVEFWRSLTWHRWLVRVRLGNTTLEGGIVARLGGSVRTCMMKPPTYWDRVAADYGYELFAAFGNCAVAAK